MIDLQEIVALSEQIAREFRPERIILFGSYARGGATDTSDIDLLVILRFRGSGISTATKILQRVRPRFPVELLVRTPERIRQRLAWNDFFLREIMETGKVLYESAHS